MPMAACSLLWMFSASGLANQSVTSCDVVWIPRMVMVCCAVKAILAQSILAQSKFRCSSSAPNKFCCVHSAAIMSFSSIVRADFN
mmetsp:Transcript_17952/g.25146  ORF Transcript_17952/g.25146 Transcript_17952/m.25146 type:complete len:85 (-) Transcript_17952:953-1207(-)